eukprot:Skav226132  [mRNA]  locus=scaffold1047:350602:354090:- [translate_table: standard]
MQTTWDRDGTVGTVPARPPLILLTPGTNHQLLGKGQGGASHRRIVASLTAQYLATASLLRGKRREGARQVTSVYSSNMLESIQSRGAHPQNKAANMKCVQEGNLQGAFAAFETWKDSALGTTPSVLVYNCLLDACIECKALPRALQIFEEMKEQHIEEQSLADVVSYNTIMKGHLATHDTSSAERVFKQMHQAGLAASRVTYHALLNALVNKGDRTGAWRIVREWQQPASPAVSY